jgi:hypothetical protein
VGTVRDALRLPGMRRIEVGYGLSITGELAGTVALVVYAFGAGGATLVAAYAASRTVAGMAGTLVLTGVTNRLRRDRLLRWITSVRAVLLAVAALLAASGQPPAAVSVHGAPRPPLHRGDCFGEIALLRDIPRTATVTAQQPLSTLTLGRPEFLTAVTGNSTSMAAADALAAHRLTAGTPDRSDGSAGT